MSLRPKKHPPSTQKGKAKNTPPPHHSNQPLAEQQATENHTPLFQSYSFSAN